MRENVREKVCPRAEKVRKKLIVSAENCFLVRKIVSSCRKLFPRAEKVFLRAENRYLGEKAVLNLDNDPHPPKNNKFLIDFRSQQN
jgi:hypothetical protein